ncbi:uncharacterized protein ASCRUDRAFT_76247 [Ascoidea rubescens DSM 1968]|uniref:Tetratricopeptide SHNi-TPR domain-containing protein n=1 Tax=Ascoidea rubescens DSM 1968 TaxID=1344418 RepID=A0A1D2VGW1_9ASCO|nr:hypothetical protein ASCRUDRAFT_76247 [Ascoidea rubescens DSM 1968]ODV60898.1 hypothetical protein ASCRUDRAFT_76247 [Ascoidea rubescens DSM 1968]
MLSVPPDLLASDNISHEINELIIEGNKFYSLKDYEQSVSKYSEACSLFGDQTSSKQYKETLYLYGKSLFSLAISKSQILGGSNNNDLTKQTSRKEDLNQNSDSDRNITNSKHLTISKEQMPQKLDHQKASKIQDSNKNNGNQNFHFDETVAEEEIDNSDNSDNSDNDLESEAGSFDEVSSREDPSVSFKEDEENYLTKTNENLKRITLTANDQKQSFSTGDISDDDSNNIENDFELAWDVLDLSRVLFETEFEELKKVDRHNNLEKVEILKKISEIYNLLGEVSLENENFKQSTADFLKSLDYLIIMNDIIKEYKISQIDYKLLSEIHYKLSLSYEFNFEDSENKSKSIENMQKAVNYVNLTYKRLLSLKNLLNDKLNETPINDNLKGEIYSIDMDIKDQVSLIEELKERLNDLLHDPTQAFKEQQMALIKGLLGQSTKKESPADINNAHHNIVDQIPKEENVSKPEINEVFVPTMINDITAMVKKRKIKPKTKNLKKKAKH